MNKLDYNSVYVKENFVTLNTVLVGLMYYDPEFFAYLKINQADDLLFCYRWLLLEMKREFAFEDSLQVLETLWASLPPSYADKEGLILYEVKLNDGSQDKVRTALF